MRLLPRTGELEDLVLEFVGRTGNLASMHHPTTRRALGRVMRAVDSYCSLLFDGHVSDPVPFCRAIWNDAGPPDAENAVHTVGKAYQDVQSLIDDRLRTQPDTEIASTEFLTWLEAEYRQRLRDVPRHANDAAATTVRPAVPEWRRDDHERGRCDSRLIDQAMGRALVHFRDTYDVSRLRGIDQILAIPASHHALMAIRPFGERTGAVARLFTYAMVCVADVNGSGLWSVNRALARERKTYLTMVNKPDVSPWFGHSQRSGRTEEALIGFCRFFLQACLEEVRFAKELLSYDALSERIMRYVALRATGEIDQPRLHPEAGFLLRQAMFHGKLERAQASRIMGIDRRAAESVVDALLDEGLLETSDEHGRLRIGISPHAIDHLLPGLFLTRSPTTAVPG